MKCFSRCRSLFCALAIAVLATLSVIRIADACSHAPPNPPVCCIVQIDATHYCIVFKGYNTAGGANPGQFCTCALKQLGPIVSIDSFQMLLCGTSEPVPGWDFSNNDASSAAWSQILGGPATGFFSAVSQPIPRGLCIDLKFVVTVLPGTTPGQLAGALARGGAVVGNGEANEDGTPRVFEVRRTGPIMAIRLDGVPHCMADFNLDGELTSQDFFDYLAEFFALEPRADFNADGTVDSQDFFDFVSAFFVGC